MRRLREDHGDWEVIASFRSKPFCVGSLEDVEEDLIDLMNSNETAFRQIVNYLRDVGYPVNSDDCDADDYAEWFTRELYDEFTLENEDELEFGYFNFKMKVFHTYRESMSRNESFRIRRKKSIKEYIDNSDTIEFLENAFEKLRYHSKNLNKTQYYLFSIAYDSFQEYRNGEGTERDIYKKCREFAEYCQTHNKNLTKMQDSLVDDILSNT